MNTDQLAKRANELHDEIETQIRSAVLKAKECGEVLIEAKKQAPHGTWMDWLEENFNASHQTACAYMRIAKHWDSIWHLFDRPEHFDALPTLQYALKMITKYKPSRMSSQADAVYNEPTNMQRIREQFNHFVTAATCTLENLLDYDTLAEWHYQRNVLGAKRYELRDGRTAIVLTTKLTTDDLDEDAWAIDEDTLKKVGVS